jgi:hypothetical protein
MLPQTERLVQRVLSLPTGTAVGPDEIGTICDVVRFSLARAPEIRARLGRPAAAVVTPRLEARDVLP